MVQYRLNREASRAGHVRHCGGFPGGGHDFRPEFLRGAGEAQWRLAGRDQGVDGVLQVRRRLDVAARAEVEAVDAGSQMGSIRF